MLLGTSLRAQKIKQKICLNRTIFQKLIQNNFIIPMSLSHSLKNSHLKTPREILNWLIRFFKKVENSNFRCNILQFTRVLRQC
jgi:hypothetical protein